MENMELVYLWVEEYKNIKQQGFNFSSKFKCKFNDRYDENNIIESPCTFTIEKNENNTSIFPDNINITAIVGENGSGKSSLLGILSNKSDPTKYKNKFFVFYDSKLKNLWLCGAKISHKCYLDISELEQKKHFELSIIEDYIKYFDNMKTVFYTDLLDESDLTKPIFDKEKDNNFYSELVNISTTQLLNQRKLIETKIEAINSESVSNFDKIYRSYRIQQIQSAIIAIHNGLELPFNLPERLVIRNINFEGLFEKLIHIFQKNEFKNLSNILKEIQKNLMNINFKNYTKWNLIVAFLLENKDNKKLIASILSVKMPNELDVFYEKVKEVSWNENKTFFDNTDKLINMLEQFEEETFNGKKSNFEIELNIKDTDFKFLEIYEKLIQQSEYFWDISWQGLSSGEETYLYQFSRFFFLNTNYKYESRYNLKVNNKEVENIIVLIDEGEVTFHPQWQKYYMKNLVIFFEKNFNQNIHIILTSHSPFILSDLPKENVIFLEKGEQKDQFKDKQTFGANIHTLLSDGFFMSDGLMGEFAKSKITEVIEVLKKESLDESEIKKCQDIISIIGEPLLQNTLKQQLDTKLYPKETELEKLEREQIELQEKIKAIKERESSETN